ncbi:hypothetical protein [Sphingosinicella rhizophila]|uniref:Uncharacterized protein n=1 Tax=Sphingosinicella rhizophila TaxID=3050082 RepID=A0ABU3Q5W0_9SPHN|nr:hypothetical protein [Sphingosinicella sp. GR2756]MDT9598692.1 hypothetical protein [Sphingosinicella sp. GR2756]
MKPRQIPLVMDWPHEQDAGELRRGRGGMGAAAARRDFKRHRRSHFDSSLGYAYIEVGDKPCRTLSICAASESQLMSNREEQAEAKGATSA